MVFEMLRQRLIALAIAPSERSLTDQSTDKLGTCIGVNPCLIYIWQACMTAIVITSTLEQLDNRYSQAPAISSAIPLPRTKQCSAQSKGAYQARERKAIGWPDG